MVNSSWRCLEFKNRKQVGGLEKRVSFLKLKNKKSVFSFSGCRGREGVSTVIVNLVDYMTRAAAGKSILLIDANLHRPVLHTSFNHQLGQGLTEILDGSASWSDALLDTGFEKVHLICSGMKHKVMAGGLDQDKLLSVINEIRSMYDFVLVDGPALLTSGDALAAASVSDATFLIVQSMNTQKQVGERAISMLNEAECFLGGVLLNRVRQVIPNWMYKLL